MYILGTPYQCTFSIRSLLIVFHLPFQAVSRNPANRTVPVQLQLRVRACLQMQLLCGFRLHCKNTNRLHDRKLREKQHILVKTASNEPKHNNPLSLHVKAVLLLKENMHVPWFWICKEMNVGLRGPLGEEPLRQKLISVKSGRVIPVKLQPLLTPFKMRYSGHSCACSSFLCL